MSRPTIVDVNFFDFRAALQRAADRGLRIEPGEKDRWREYVREHNIMEAAFKHYGATRYEKLKPVIIDEEGEWGGYYLFSREEEACLKWARTGD